MKELRLSEIEKLNLTPESMDKVSRLRQTKTMQSLIRDLSVVIENNTTSTADIKRAVENDREMLNNIVLAMGKATPTTQAIDVVDRVNEWKFTIQRDRLGNITEIIAKGTKT